jgi:hypothetical protein
MVYASALGSGVIHDDCESTQEANVSLGALEKRLRILRRLGANFRRQPKVAIFLRDVDLGIREQASAVPSGETTDVIGVQVGH